MELQCSEAQFLKDVSGNKIQILHDDGLYRHIRFRKDVSYFMGFDLVTWPGYLCFCGDMGEFVFSRTSDMFSFFRGSGYRGKEHSTLAVNFEYWAEKCEAEDKSDGLKKYDPDKFREVINDILNDDEDVTDELRQAVEDEVLCAADDGPYSAHEAADSFEWEGKRYFSDFYEHSLEVYTYRFIWCCYALAWGIAEYYKEKSK